MDYVNITLQIWDVIKEISIDFYKLWVLQIPVILFCLFAPLNTPEFDPEFGTPGSVVIINWVCFAWAVIAIAMTLIGFFVS